MFKFLKQQKKISSSSSEKETDKKDEKTVKTSEKKYADSNVKKFDLKSEAGYGIFLKPHTTEKTAVFGTQDVYSFVVSNNANKIEIKNAFHKMYGVRPISVRTVCMHSEPVMFKRVAGAKSAWKKAYIKVPKNSKITVYEGV